MWGYVDDEGNVVIPGQFHIADEFNSRDYAVVMKDGYYGVINKKGETIVPFEYHNVLCRMGKEPPPNFVTIFKKHL